MIGNVNRAIIVMAACTISLFAVEKVACVGDSITYGARIKKRKRLSYPMQLDEALGDGYQVRNFGVSGRTLLRKGDLPYWRTKQYKQALAWKPNVVVIKLGTNDTKMNNWKYRDELEKDLIDLAKSFISLPSKPKVFLALPIPAFVKGKRIDGGRVANGVVPVVKKVAQKLNLPIIDLYSRMLNKRKMMPDGIHPNARGAYELAAEVYKSITGKKYDLDYESLRAKCMKKILLQDVRWQGFDMQSFDMDGVDCKLVFPKKAAKGKPWIWRARFFGHQPQLDIALLKRGYHLAYCDVANLFGAPVAIKRWDAFYQLMTKKGLSKKVVLEGMSRGGLIIFNWAVANTDKVRCIYADAPVSNIASWPGGEGKSGRAVSAWRKCIKAYGFENEKSAIEYKGNPVDHATALAKARIPVIIVYGKNDGIVPPSENCLLFERRFRKAGGTIVMIGKDKCGHHPHSLKDPQRLIDFIVQSEPTDEKTTSNNYEPKNNDAKLPKAIQLRDGLSRSYSVFKKGGNARVAFLGGSITERRGWRNFVAQSLKKRFPNVKFDFVFTGIASTDSSMGAFRMEKDVFKNGRVDLLFIESAVNELHNGRTKDEIIRATEGIVRHALHHNPNIDVVAQYFYDPEHMKNLRKGIVPWQVVALDKVSERYRIASINQIEMLKEAIDAKEITQKEFGGCHPRRVGHKLYARNIDRLFDAAWMHDGETGKREVPAPIAADNYQSGVYLNVKLAKLGDGWRYVPKWKPEKGGTRRQFVNCPIIETTTPGAEATFEFTGTAIGIILTAGYDAGILEYKIDDGPFQSRDLFLKWSKALHIPWIQILAHGLSPKKHLITLRTSKNKNKLSKGHACRINYFAVNLCKTQTKSIKEEK